MAKDPQETPQTPEGKKETGVRSWYPALLTQPLWGWFSIALVLLVSLFFGNFARIDRIDNRLEDNVQQGETLAAYNRFLNVFGNDRILLVGFSVKKIDSQLIKSLFSTELTLLNNPNVQTVLSPITPLRLQLGVATQLDLEKFLEEERQLDRYIDNLKATKALEKMILSTDWTVGGIVIRLKHETGDLVGPTLDQIRNVLATHFPYKVYLTGIPEITRLILEMTRRDQRIFSPMTVLLIAIVLLILYRSLFGLLIPLIAICSSFIWTKGLLIAMGNSVNFVTSILPPMILSIALTYCIHIMTEYFEASRNEKNFSPEILWKSFLHVLQPILLSGFTTVIGFGSLIYTSIAAIGQFGIYSSIGTIFSIFLALTVVPAGVFATRRVGDRVSSIQGLEVWVEKIAVKIVDNPKRVWLAVFVLLGISILGLSRLPIETSLIRYLPEDHSIQEANRFVEKNLCGIVPVELLLESKENRLTKPDMVHRVRKLQESFSKLSFVDRSLSYVDLIQDFDRMFSGEPNHIPPSEEEICDYLSFYSPSIASESEEEPEENAAQTSFTPFQAGGMLGEMIASDAMIAHISLRFQDRSSREMVEEFKKIENLVKKEFEGVNIRATLTGRALMWAQVSEVIVYNEITSFSMSLFIITLIISVYFRSLKLGLVAMIPNVLPMIFTYGFMGLTGTTFNTVTGMIASIAIGLAVDDTIHIICQFKHELLKDGDEKGALVRTMVHKGRATIFTSLVLCSGFFVLTLSGFGPTKYFGIFISIGVAAALLCELLITPVALYTFKPLPINKIP